MALAGQEAGSDFIDLLRMGDEAYVPKTVELHHLDAQQCNRQESRHAQRRLRGFFPNHVEPRLGAAFDTDLPPMTIRPKAQKPFCCLGFCYSV